MDSEGIDAITTRPDTSISDFKPLDISREERDRNILQSTDFKPLDISREERDRNILQSTDVVDNGLSNNEVTETENNNEDQTSDGKKPEANCQCKCAFFKGRPCRERYSEKGLQEIRAQYDNLDHKDLDFVILAKLESGMHLSVITARSTKKRQIERKQQNTDYFYHGQSICRDMFKYMHNISQNRLSALIKHYKEKGIKARIHGNVNRVQPNAFKKDDVDRVVEFISKFAENYSQKTVSSVRKSNHSSPAKKITLINCTKKQVFDEYIRSCGDHRKVSLSRFRTMWRKLLPHIRLLPAVKPATDNRPTLVKVENFPPNPSYSFPGYAITSL